MTQSNTFVTGTDKPWNDLLIHIGYPRTGTTWLQRVVFGTNVDHFDGPFYALNRPKKESTWKTVKCHPLFFDPTTVRKHYTDRYLADGRSKFPVVSNERLSGDAMSGGYDQKEIADRLASTFPEARILITIREQKDSIRSWYAYYLLCGGTCSLSQFIDPLLRAYRIPHFDRNFFAYDRLIEYYRSLFGEDRVLVLPYENFRASPESQVRAIVDFCEEEFEIRIPEDLRLSVAPSLAVLRLRRFINPFIRRDPVNGYSSLAIERALPLVTKIHRSIEWVMPHKLKTRYNKKISEEVESIIGDYYAASNRITQQFTTYRLDEHGYY